MATQTHTHTVNTTTTMAATGGPGSRLPSVRVTLGVVDSDGRRDHSGVTFTLGSMVGDALGVAVDDAVGDAVGDAVANEAGDAVVLAWAVGDGVPVFDGVPVAVADDVAVNVCVDVVEIHEHWAAITAQSP